ncbi:MAG: hypothetical protein M3512_00725 [Bacteroidota bacterium]|nr:hypothetical protein [Bacteroidota bacterium]
MKKIIRNITSVPQFFSNTISSAGRNLHKNFVTPFLPTYDVVFIMYSVIPGKPLDITETIYNFEKGESEKANDFYQKMLHSTENFKMMPSEVVMRKKNKVVKATQFGPIKEIQATMA